MKTSKRNKLLSLALTGGLGLFSASNAFAAANDDISNTATLSYEVGTVLQTVIESAGGVGNATPGVGAGTPTLFKEDRVVNFTVVREAGASRPVAPGSTDVTANAVPFLIQNLGNAPLGFLLKGVHNLAGTDPYTAGTDIFTPINIRTYVDINDDGIYTLAGDGAVEFVGSLSATPGVNFVRVFVISDIPTLRTAGTGIQDNDLAVVSLVAQVSVDGTTGIAADAIVSDDNGNTSPGGTFSVAGLVGPGAVVDIIDDPATMQTVFNDPAGTEDGAGTAPGVIQNGQHADASSYIIQTAALTVAKSSEVIYDPLNLDSFTAGNFPKAIPTAYIQYTITVTNDPAAGASADLTTLVDAIAVTGTAAVALDVNLLDSGKALGATLNFPGDEEGGLVTAVRVDTLGTARPSQGLSYCLSAVADGCTYSGGLNGSVSVDFSAVAGMAVEAGYTAGELKPGESVEIVFNVIVQ
ncbi:MAG: hypothetical protein KAT12_00985 [Gammaproteobacteria bacterium]|nr:hypothetical protein [Gammaproteobacteria bacterium]